MKRTMLIVSAMAVAALVPPAHAAGDAAAGKAKAASCAGCHGANGEGKANNPALAGKTESDIANALKEYKTGKRPNAVMKGFVAGLGDKDIDNIGAYYASLKGK